MYPRKIHYLSGIILSLFVGVHLINHFFSLFGAESHIEVMTSLRLVYRNLLVESVLMFAVVTQIFSGLKLYLAKRKIPSLKYFDKLHLYSGLYLAVFLLIHVSAVLTGRYVLDLDTNFYFGVAGLNSFPVNLFFIPYYSLAIIAFFAHIAAIHSKKMKLNILSFPPGRQAKLILIFGIFLTALILFGLTNRFGGFEIPVEYNVLIGK